MSLIFSWWAWYRDRVSGRISRISSVGRRRNGRFGLRTRLWKGDRPSAGQGANVIGGILAGQAIAKAGVQCVFTLCGGHVAPIYIGLQMSGVRIVDTRHEAAAAHAADAWGRLTGIPGVAIVTAGPGVTNAVTGIANAFQAESPMVLIGGKVGMTRMDQGS
ncbi:MAG: hypothetical protein KJ042_08820, partial [Deltaproteobacteria bacterium]|nr:hypothetical protein [Deltaproteobacteria bacterium]